MLITGMVLIGLVSRTFPLAAQDDVSTRNGSSAYGGGFITGPASNPLSLLNGPAYRTFGSKAPYDLPDFRPAYILNEKLPFWIWFGLEERLRLEGYQDGGFKANNNDWYFLNRFRLQVTVSPVGWLRIVSQVQDAQPFLQKPPYGPPNENRWDLKLAYVELGDPERHWVSVRVGRQIINYNNTLMANSEWRNQARSYDAVVANLHYDRFRAGIFAASIVNPLIVGISHHQEGSNLYGIYAGIDRLLPDSVLEPFVLWRVAPSVGAETAAETKTGRLDEKVYGFRWKGRAITDLDYSFETVWERGSAGKSAIHAAATTFGAAYRVSMTLWKPRVFSQYDYASGDKNPNDNVQSTFDTIYPTAHDRFGISDQFGWQNIEAARAGVTIEPRHRWTVTVQYLHFWVASATDALYNTSGVAIVRDTTGAGAETLVVRSMPTHGMN